LSSLHLTPLEDPSNREPLYRRNRIRHEVIPLLEQIAPGATRVIARVAGLLQDDAGYLAEQTARYVDELVHIEKSVCRIDRMRLAQLPTAVQRRVLITSVARASRGLYRPPANRLEALRAAAHQGTVGRRIELGGGWLALVEYNAVAIGRAAELETALRRASRLPLLPPGERVELAERVELVLENGWRLTCCTSLPGRWLLRTRHPGDRIVPEPGRPAVRLQDWLVNRKVPAYLRDWLALLADDGTVLWVAGLMGTSFLHPEGLIHVELVAEQHERGTAPVEERGTRVAEEQTLAEQLGLERVLIDEETLHRRIAELGDEITAYYHGKRPLLIGVLTGAFVFMADLVRHLPIPLSIDFIAVSSYGQATVTSGVVRIIKDLDRPIEGEDVLLVEDIVDSGLTLKYLSDLLRRRNPASLKVVALLRKQKEGALEVPIDWVGFEIPDEFVVGYGLDVAGRFRNLPFVAVYRNR
jgi:hypoxanthine phosphoribosyltransferase